MTGKICIVCGKEMQEHRRGNLRRVFKGWVRGFCLSYCKIILPKSAILVSADPWPLAVDVDKERTVLTVRRYSATELVNKYDLSFLWPEMDGSTLLDLPMEYREVKLDSTRGKE